MTREEIIAILERRIKSMEFAQVDPQVDPREKDQQFIHDALERAKETLERIKAGDEAAIQELSDLFERGRGT
jgi:hypothetical protein